MNQTFAYIALIFVMAMLYLNIRDMRKHTPRRYERSGKYAKPLNNDTIRQDIQDL